MSWLMESSIGFGGGQQLRGAVKGKRNRCMTLIRGGLRWRGVGCGVFSDESATDREEGALVDDCAGGIEGRKTETVGMLDMRAGRKHDVAVKEKVAWFVERDGTRAGQIDAMGGANSLNR